jgi:SAM-dependent methyltransferase
MKQLLGKMWDNARDYNRNNILSLLGQNGKATLLDLGCDDGSWTRKLAERIGTDRIFGVDIIDDALKKASGLGVNCIRADLNDEFPYHDNSFDVIHANQVIEHVGDVDLFISEIFRILKSNGYVVMSTENGSSWCNTFASILGWQIFSLTNVSKLKLGIGNPLALHREKAGMVRSWTHKTIFNYLGFRELLSIHGFVAVRILGAGYFPFPAFCGRIDRRHAHFITLRGFKTR